MELRRLGIAIALAALLTLGAGLGTADAHKISFGSQVAIDEGGPKGAEGHVSSGQPKCLFGRRVILYIVDLQTGDLIEIDAVITDREGDWEVEEDLFAGDYVARVTPRTVKVHGKPHRCRGDRSLQMRL